MNVANGDWRHTDVLQVQRAREPFEQSLPTAEDDRSDDDRELIDDAGLLWSEPEFR